MFGEWKTKIRNFQHKHEAKLEVLFFVGGFAFDAFLVSEVDDLFALIQQAVYLLIIAALIHYEILYRMMKWRPTPKLSPIWDFRNLLSHFLLGTLLNIYSLFYIKSASFVSSLVFLALMIAMILANEHPRIKKSKVSFKTGLFAICLFSYISILYPLLLGYIGWTPFGLSLVTTLAIFYLQFRWLKTKLPNEKILFQAQFGPGISVLIVFALFYFMGWIPPVPLSAKQQGIYHLIEKKNGSYNLSFEKVWWKFWQRDDNHFLAEPSDKLYYYIQIYSPARISGDVFLIWSRKNNKRNWEVQDRIPIKVTGGRKEGFRGYAIKNNFQGGDWRVAVETASHLEITRMGFEVVEVDQAKVNPNRVFEVLSR